jgi:hypothetical protein
MLRVPVLVSVNHFTVKLNPAGDFDEEQRQCLSVSSDHTKYGIFLYNFISVSLFMIGFGVTCQSKRS